MSEQNIADQVKVTEILIESKSLLTLTAENLSKAQENYSHLKVCLQNDGVVDTEKFKEAQEYLMEQIKLRQIALKSYKCLMDSLDSRLVFVDQINEHSESTLGNCLTEPMECDGRNNNENIYSEKHLLEFADTVEVDDLISCQSPPASVKEQNNEEENMCINRFESDDDSEKENDDDEDMSFTSLSRKAQRKRFNFIADLSSDEEMERNSSTAAIQDEEVQTVKKRRIRKDISGIFDISETEGSESDDDDQTAKVDDLNLPAKENQDSLSAEEDETSEIAEENDSPPNTTSIYNFERNDHAYDYIDSCTTNKGAFEDKEVETLARKYMPSYVNSRNPSTSTGYHASDIPKSFTVGTLKEIQEQLDARPSEDNLDDPPDFLNVTMMRHQLHALKFMRWREDQKVKGGILADDMGLGKTLITISLILRQKQIKQSQSFGEQQIGRDSWISQGRPAGGTLIICTASLIRQWEAEIDKMVMSGHLSCYLYHGGDRIQSAVQLAKFDVVVTSYHTIVSDYNDINPLRGGPCFKIRFQRIVLDEGHIIRNPDTRFANSVWNLEAESRWILSGTPIQNKEFDLFAVIKFLRCSPFDSLQYWKQHVPAPRKGRDYQPSSKLQTLLKSILLRRTKKQLEESGHIERLPEKNLVEIKFKLDEKERNIYNRLMTYSKTVFAQFLAQQKDKHGSYIFNEYSFGANIDEQFRSFFRKYNRKEDRVHGSRILVLLLRLRQATCHASLIKAMVDQTDLEVGIDQNQQHNVNNDEEMGPHFDILRKLVQDTVQPNSEQFDSQEDFWNIENEVFDTDRPSSKMIKMIEILEEVVKAKNKVIVVSQWVGHLNLVKRMLVFRNIRYCEFTGQIQVSKRTEIVNNFNDMSSGIEVMLLSLTCGGVGLNLVGANVMFIMDLHWNPQLEIQGQDRIYRFGQKKDVQIYKFICEDSIEERVLELQRGKLQIADSLLTGSRMTAANKLSLNDLMMLFGLKQPTPRTPVVASSSNVVVV